MTKIKASKSVCDIELPGSYVELLVMMSKEGTRLVFIGGDAGRVFDSYSRKLASGILHPIAYELQSLGMIGTVSAPCTIEVLGITVRGLAWLLDKGLIEPEVVYGIKG